MKDIGRELREMNDFSKRRFLTRASEAVREEFLNTGLAPEEKVPNDFQLSREIEFFVQKVPPEHKVSQEAQMREALKDYAPAHIEFTADPDELSLLNIQQKIEGINQLTQNTGTTRQLLSAANGVIDQIMEKVLDKMPIARESGAQTRSR